MVVKEKPQEGLSEEVLQEYRAEAAARRRWEEEHRQMTPEAPDESGEIGIYDEDASRWFGGQFVYRTESSTYFAYTGEGYKLVNPLHLESYLMSLKKRAA